MRLVAAVVGWWERCGSDLCDRWVVGAGTWWLTLTVL